jgi:hypothetical protein
MRIEDFAEYIDAAFNDHFDQTSDNFYPFPERQGDPISYMIQEAAGIDEPPAEDLRAVLEDQHHGWNDKDSMYDENPFSSDAHYQSRGIQIAEYLEEWEFFRKSILTEARLFNSQAEGVLAHIFEGIESHTTAAGKKVVVNAGPGRAIKTLYRARAFQSDNELTAAIARPDAELGPPPSAYAVAGRMNSRGIGVFYGATHGGVALAEIRPPVGSRVLVGRFSIIRPLRLLDVEAMQSIQTKGSIFQSNFIRALEKTAFLNMMSTQIARPVMPNDEASEYLVTQAIADYLAMRREPALDGIIYPSAQQNGSTKRNVVLFHKSARVEDIDLPKHTNVSAHVHEYDEEGTRPDYGVFVRKPPLKEKSSSPGQSLLAIFKRSPLYPDSNYDARDPALRLDLSSLRVHHITSVRISADDFPVRRHETKMSAEEVKALEEKEDKLDF